MARVRGAVLAWVALSWLWSDRRAQTVLELRRTAVYAAVVLALVVLVRRRPRGTCSSRHTRDRCGRRLRARALPHRDAHRRPVRGTLLAQPLGYANALAALAAIGIVLGVGLAADAPRAAQSRLARRDRPRARGSPPADAQPRRGSRARRRSRHLRRRAHTMTPRRSCVRAASSPRESRVAAIVAAMSRLERRECDAPLARRLARRRASRSCARPAQRPQSRGVGARGTTSPRAQAPVRSSARVGRAAAVRRDRLDGAARLALGRRVASSSTSHIAGGSGAGTFALAWARSGLIETRGGALDAHSLYLETLAELGRSRPRPACSRSSRCPWRGCRDSTGQRTGRRRGVRRLPRPCRPRLGLGDARGRARGALLRRGGARRATRLSREPVTPRAAQRSSYSHVALGALSIAGARSSSEPGVAPPR